MQIQQGRLKPKFLPTSPSLLPFAHQAMRNFVIPLLKYIKSLKISQMVCPYVFTKTAFLVVIKHLVTCLRTAWLWLDDCQLGYHHHHHLHIVLRQLYRLFQREFSRQCDVVLPVTVSSIFSFLKVFQ